MHACEVTRQLVRGCYITLLLDLKSETKEDGWVQSEVMVGNKTLGKMNASAAAGRLLRSSVRFGR